MSNWHHNQHSIPCYLKPDLKFTYMYMYMHVHVHMIVYVHFVGGCSGSEGEGDTDGREDGVTGGEDSSS